MKMCGVNITYGQYKRMTPEERDALCENLNREYTGMCLLMQQANSNWEIAKSCIRESWNLTKNLEKLLEDITLRAPKHPNVYMVFDNWNKRLANEK